MSKEKFEIHFEEEINDFGFETIDKSEILADEGEKYKKKLLELKNAIMPLLQNLRKDPEKDMIHWPNRDEKINNFIKKINKIVEE